MKHVGILIVVIAFVALATLYSVMIPLGEGPDEPGHAAYVLFLAREGRLPVQRAAGQQSEVPGEGHQPPLAYILAVPLVMWLPVEQRQFDLPGNARFTWAGGDELNAVAHGSREYPPWGGVVLAWHLARLASVLAGAVTVLCTYGTALALLGTARGAVALLAAALVAFNPQFLFIAALVNNDVLLAALSAALLWLILSNRRAAGFAIGMGAILGAALLTKQSAVLLMPLALLAIVERAGLGTVRRLDAKRRGAVGQVSAAPLFSGVRGVLAMGLLALGTAALIAGWWYVRNWRLYGDPLGLAVFRTEFMTQPFAAGQLAAWRDALVQLHSSFWARFGWMNVSTPAWLLWSVTAVELLALVGLLRAARRLRGAGWHWLAGGRWSLAALPALTLAWVVSFALTAGLVAWQGRLLFPALPAIAIVLAYGLNQVLTPRHMPTAGRRGVALGVAVSVGLGLVALWIPFGVIRPAYPFHTLPEPVAQTRIGTPVYGRFGRAGESGAELRGWRLAGTAQAGSALELTLMWHALARQNRDWVVFIHLVDEHGEIRAEDNRPPQDGAFPMTQWVLGDWVEDRHPLQLPADLAPGVYALRVGLYDRGGSEERTGVYDERNELVGDYLDIGSISVR